MSTHTSYYDHGYCVLDNFLPLGTANRLNTLYTQEREWEQLEQKRNQHYQHVFRTSADCLPRENECYIAKFGRSKKLEASTEFLNIYESAIKPCIGKALNIKLTSFDTRCYRLLPGDLYRTHIDDYAGDVGLIYYINKHWVWDWGGILHLCTDGPDADKKAECILPKFNRAVLINHKIFRFPHFISSVESFALEPRYTIISFNR